MGEGLDQRGEFGIIDLFREKAGAGRSWVTEGIGDDCAVLDTGGGTSLLVTTDMLAEGVHFLRSGIPPWKLGWKSLAVNISDIAAMGGEPAAAFLALGLTAWKDWLIQNNAAVTALLLTVFGALIIGNGLKVLSASWT